ncbi:MAG: phosphoribosylglycinamide formyltransferase [Anaerolineaceae bacterium]|nr:MAG: phosphoribosylglycinamide formyltransferase [Anaerolineaceae bacterium]
MAKKRLAVLISGRGSNMQALMNAPHLAGEIVLVVANRAASAGLEVARQAGIQTHYFPLKPYKDAGKSREAYDRDLAALIRGYAPDLTVLAGWMHILSAGFIEALNGHVINLHPALPGQFAGANAIERAYQAYQRGEITQTGCMVHYVVPEVDAGPVIDYATVPILPDDTLETLTGRIQHAEHRLIVAAVNQALRDND